MIFTNLSLFRLPEGFDVGDLEQALAANPLRDIGPLEMTTTGFVPPIGETVTHIDGNATLLCMAVTEKILPPAVVAEELARRIEKIRETDDRDVGAGERRKLRDEILHDLLPQAFSRTRRTMAYIDRATGWVVIDTATGATAEDVLSAVRRAIGSFPAAPPIPATELLTHWLIEGAAYPPFQLGEDCVLHDRGSPECTIRCRRQDLTDVRLRDIAWDGMSVRALGLSYADRMDFVLEDAFTVRRLRIADAVVDEHLDAEYDSIEAERAALFALTHREIGGLLKQLESTFGLVRCGGES